MFDFNDNADKTLVRAMFDFNDNTETLVCAMFDFNDNNLNQHQTHSNKESCIRF